MTETPATYTPGSDQDPNRTDHPYGYSIRERHDLIKAVQTLSEFCQRYKQERDEARSEVRRLRCAVGTPVTEWEVGMNDPSPHNTLNEIVAWARVQFPGATVEGTLRHLRKELDEAEHALAAGDMEALAVEFADVIHLGAQGVVCALPEADADHIVRAKLAINKVRQWAEPDEYGVVEHVREGE